jgi:hypothetical protein
MSNQLAAIDCTSEIAKLTENFTGRQWVFDDIDRWLQESRERFFILAGAPGVGKSAITAHFYKSRKDVVAAHFCQLEQEKTLRPSQVLRSIAAQLNQAFPYYSEALLNTIKSTLSVEAKININHIDDLESGIQSTVQQFKINNVNPSDIANELDILIRAPLAALPRLYQQYQQTPPAIAIIAIDGLDLSVATEQGVQEDEDLVTLFAALSEDESLPAWVRFLFTTRPDRRVMREFEPLKPYLIDEMTPGNQSDIRQYIERRRSSPTLTALGQEQTERLLEQSQGNFRYAKSLLDDLAAGQGSFEDVSSPPLTIIQVYETDLRRRFLAAEWRDRHHQILQVIAKAQQPVTEEELIALTGILPRQLRQDLWGVRQFLDVMAIEAADGSIEAFRIFHPSLQAYLSTRDTTINT